MFGYEVLSFSRITSIRLQTMDIKLSEILSEIHKTGKRVNFANSRLNEAFVLQTHKYVHCDSITFTKVEFADQVFIWDQNLGVGIKFVGCTFFGAVTFRNIAAKGTDAVFDIENRSIAFEHCKFYRAIEIVGDKTEIELDVEFSKSEFLDIVKIEEIAVTSRSIKFNQCNFEKALALQANRIGDRIQIIDSVVREVFQIIKNECEIVEIINSRFHYYCTARQNRIRHVFSLYDAVFDNEVSIQGNISEGTLLITGGEYKRAIRITYGDFEDQGYKGFKNLHIRNATFSNGFFFDGRNRLSHAAAIAKLISIDLMCSSLLRGDLHLQDLEIEELSLTGFNTNANIVFTNISVQKLHIYRFFNYAQLLFSNLQCSDMPHPLFHELSAPGELRLIDSNLGNAHFFQVNFASFDIVEVKNVILSGITVSNVTWFDNSKVNVQPEVGGNAVRTKKNKRNSLVSKRAAATEMTVQRELYRQLKYAMEKNGDRPHALAFQGIEMDYYRKMLRLKRKKALADRIILWTSLSNDFGQNWIKPMWLLLVSTLIWYSFICLSLAFYAGLDGKHVELFTEIFCKRAYLFPVLLNPAHSISTFRETIEHIPNIVYFLDFLQRITSAYLVFQIVTAFRKYVR